MQLELTITDLAAGGARSRAWPSTSGTAPARAATRSTRRASRTRTTCAACRSPTPPARRLHQHLPGLLHRALAAHPLRGLPGPGVDHRRGQRRRHLAGRPAAGRVRAGLRPARLRGVRGEPGRRQPRAATTCSATTAAASQLAHRDRRRHLRVHGQPGRRGRHHHGPDGRAAGRRRRPVRRAGRTRRPAAERCAPERPPSRAGAPVALDRSCRTGRSASTCWAGCAVGRGMAPKCGLPAHPAARRPSGAQGSVEALGDRRGGPG